MKLKHLVLSAGTAAMLAVQSCGGSASVSADPSTPDGAIMASVQAFKSNNASEIVNTYLTAEQRSKAAAEWDNTRKNEKPSEEENQQFQMQMESLVSGQLIDQVMPMVEAQLAQVNNEQIAGMVGMMGGMALQSPDLTEEQKAQAGALMQSLSEWVKSADVTNPENVRKVLVIAQSAAKKLDLKDLNAVAALNFDQLIGKGDIVLAALKDALNVYGIDLNKSLDSMTIDKVDMNGDTATVTISFTIFGTKQTVTSTMTKQGNRWFDAESSKKIAEGLSNM